MRILVAGEGGLLAPALVSLLASQGHEVVAAGKAAEDMHEAGTEAQLISEAAGSLETPLRAVDPDAAILFPWRDPLRGSARGAEAQTVEMVRAVAAAGARRVVYWGSSATYELDGSLPTRPLREGDPLATIGPGGQLARIETAVLGCAAEAGVAANALRAATVVGGRAGWPLGELAPLAVLPRLGSNPPLQMIDVEDAAAAALHALNCSHPGVYNVAADGLIMLSELARAMGRPTVRLPVSVWTALFGARRLVRLPAPHPRTVGLLQYCRVMDNSRLKTHLGFRPRFAGREALARYRRAAR